MSERDESYPAAGGWSADPGTVRHGTDDWREQTTPGMTPVPPPYAASGARPYAAPVPPAYAASGAPPYAAPEAATAPDYSHGPLAVRRADAPAALLLVLAGIAAGVSLLLRWLDGRATTGWDLLRLAWDQRRAGIGEVFRTGMWQPVAVVLAGAVLFLLGLLLLVPARTHRALGVLALLVALGAGAGVLVPLSQSHWHGAGFDLGFWFACAVAVLGVLGGLKAMLTGPRLDIRA